MEVKQMARILIIALAIGLAVLAAVSAGNHRDPTETPSQYSG